MLNFDRSTVKHAVQNIQNDCLQWLSRSFRVHQIFGPDPAGGAYSAPQTPQLVWGDLLLRGGEGRGKMLGGTGREGERRGRGGKEKGREERGGYGPPNANSWIRPLVSDAFRRHISVCNQSNRLRCNKLLSEILYK